MRSITLEGVYPPVVTPFTDTGDIDRSAIDHNLDLWSDTNINGYVVFGSNGESVHLSIDEKVDIVERFVKNASGKQVIAGTGLQSTKATIDLTKRCADCGADATLVINPSFYPLSNESLLSHYLAVADRSPIPILIYNVPKFTGKNIDVSVITEASAHPNILGIKDSSGDVTQMSRIIANTRDDFVVLAGTINVLYPACAMGADGAVTALANCAPELCTKLYRLATTNMPSEARQLQQMLIPPNVAVTGTYGIPGLKVAMDMTGYMGGAPRLPLKPLSHADRDTLTSILRNAGIVR